MAFDRRDTRLTLILNLLIVQAIVQQYHFCAFHIIKPLLLLLLHLYIVI